MTGKLLSPQKIAALWRAYKIRQTANYVGTHCHVSHNTAAKYILQHNFAARFAKLQAKANEFADEDQAKSLASTIKAASNLRFVLAAKLLAHVQEADFEATIADFNKIVRLERYLRGEPDSLTEQKVSFEWLDVDE